MKSHDENSAQEQLERQLLAVTAPPSAETDPLEGEPAELREGWLTLAKLLQDRDERIEQQPITLNPNRPPAASLAGRIVAIAVAASLLIGLGVWGFVFTQRPHVASVSPIRNDATVIEATQESEVASAEYDWEDEEFDEAIQLTGDEMLRVQQEWYISTGPYGLLSEQFGEFENDLSGDSL